ncbi:MAG: mobilization protein [Pseudomonadota bacterium]
MTSPAQERIDKARLKVSQAQARLQALNARAAVYERKADTRRKIILGALLLEAAGKDQRYANILCTLLGRIGREADRHPFDGWEPPSSPTIG